MSYVWIDPAILDWNRYIDSWSTAHAGKEQRSYAHWGHAERLLRGDPDEFRRIDLLTSLKRAVDFRARLIHNIWKLKNIPLRDIPNGQLERLAHFGVVRPRQLHRLVAVRNSVEHEDAPPPDHDSLADLVDLVWYFLRSTDGLVTKTTDTVYLTPEDPVHHRFTGTLRGGPDDGWALELDLRLDPQLISLSARDQWVTVKTMVDPFAALMREDIANELGVPRRAERNALDPETGEFMLFGIMVGTADHMRRAIELLLTPF